MQGTPTTYYKALNRNFTMMGVDQQLFFLFVGICLPIAFSARFNLTMDLVAVVVFTILHTIGILITRLDNQILAVYRRHIHYKKYYAPISGIHAKSTIVRPSVPFYQGKRGLA